MPKIQLPISEKEYKDAGSKFITIPAGSSGKAEVGDTIALQVECGLPDWDTPGRSIKFPVKVIQKDSIDVGKADKISCGVSADGIWKFKEVKSMEEFHKKYLPEDAKRYPITMRVSKEEQAMILEYRGVGYTENRREGIDGNL